MTNIRSMEELEALPIDRVVRVDGIDWTRTEKGLMRDSVDLPLFHFEGRVIHDAVQDVDTMPPVVGEWWAGTSRTYCITRVTERRLYYMSFRGSSLYNPNGSSTRTAWSQSTTMHRIGEMPSELESQRVWIDQYAALQEANRQLREARDTAVRQHREVLDQATQQARKPAQIRNYLTSIRNNLDQIAQLMEE